VKDYPLSAHVDEAKQRLESMKRPVPEADPVAYSRMKYEVENHSRPGVLSHTLGIFKQHPDTTMAAKSGTPQMTGLRPTIPATVPAVAAGPAAGVTDVTAATGSAEQLDKNPDARMNPAANTAGATDAANTQAPQNSVMEYLNHGSEQQLQRLPGVSKSTARKIIGARPYTSVDDLKRAGISQKVIDSVRKLAGPSAAPAGGPGETQK
jgi:DNA uptake protein ComE-like DNA-binding protein